MAFEGCMLALGVCCAMVFVFGSGCIFVTGIFAFKLDRKQR